MAIQIRRQAKLAVLLSSSTAMTLLTPLAAFAQDVVELAPINVKVQDDPVDEQLTSIVAEDPSDTGTTRLGTTSINTRGDGSGDANQALTALPTVQIPGQASVTAGENGDSVLDLQPVELSISGGRTDQNLILLNGMNIGSVTGNTSPYGTDPLDQEDGNPNFYNVYGLHSQTQYVHSDFLEAAEVMDSNVSAEYGGFQGGVVSYELIKPKREASGKVSYSYQSDKLTTYNLVTNDGTNPENRDKPEWDTHNFALQLTQPIGERSALVFGHSIRTASTTKDKDPQYKADTANSKSTSEFTMLGFQHEFLNGHTLNVTGTYTDYDQDWDSNYVDQMRITTATSAAALQLNYGGDLGDRSIGNLSLRNLQFELNASYQDNKTQNLHGSNAYYAWYGAYYRSGYQTNAFDDWCDSSAALSGTGVPCRTGGLGDRSFDDNRLTLSGKLSGDVWNGGFVLGAGIEQQKARRSGEGFVFNSSTARGNAGDYVCPPGSLDCIDSQYFRTRIVQEAYDVQVDTTKAHAYLELDQEWGAFGLRAGVRADYDDYLDNLNVAPRFVARWEANSDLRFTLGANRYYDDKSFAYAIHDAVPRGLNQRRSAPGGVVGDWETRTDLGEYKYNQGGLKTPYTDELSLGVVWNDNWSGGVWRARLIDRHGKDQFAGTDTGRNEATLTNDGKSRYSSFSVEYAKQWANQRGSAMDYVGFGFSAIIADRSFSPENIFVANDGIADEFIWYNDTSYTRQEFDQATGNLDIPVKASFELNGSWKRGKYKAGLSADVTLGFDGARYTGDDRTRTNPTYGRQSHMIYEDFSFKPVVTLNLSGQVRLAEIKGNPVNLDIQVNNLFNTTGNKIASASNPWIRGRSVWLGTSYEW